MNTFETILPRITPVIILCTFVAFAQITVPGCSRFDWASSQHYELPSPASPGSSVVSSLPDSGVYTPRILPPKRTDLLSVYAPGSLSPIAFRTVRHVRADYPAPSGLFPQLSPDKPTPPELVSTAEVIQPPAIRQNIMNADAPEETACININTADIQQLTKLPGIGQKRALDIIQYRSKKPFRKKSDLQRIKGIGKKMLQKLSPHVCDL